MKISAVISEFSPFHFGHEYIIKKAKSVSDAVIAIMSGSFTERGECAITSKYARAKAALLGGADLVLELPFPFSCAGNEAFARGAVGIAESLGCVDEIVCGTECGDSAIITKTAKNLSTQEFARQLESAKGLNRNKSYAEMYFGVYKELFGETDVFNGSNNILAIAYAKELIKTGSAIKINAVRRIGQSFSGSGNGFESGTSLRKKILAGCSIENLVPSYSGEILNAAVQNGDIYRTSKLFEPCAGIFRFTDTADFCGAAEINDELYNRIKNAFLSSSAYEEVVEKAETRQYSASKVRRAILYSVMGVDGWNLTRPTFTTVLGMNETGREILSRIRKTKKIDLITKPADYDSPSYTLCKKADSLFLLTREKPVSPDFFQTSSPVIL